MQTDFHAARVVAVVVALLALLAACAPAAQGPYGAPPAASETSAPDGSSQGDPLPAATPDPAPVRTTSPGEHLDVIGTVTALSTSSIDVDGVSYGLTAATEVKGSLTAGTKVKLEYVTNADGSRTVIEAKGAGYFDD